MAQKIDNDAVAKKFNEYPPKFRKKLLKLRKIILDTSKIALPTIGVEETLKWNEPSYLPKKKNIGTTVRISWLQSKPDQYGMYFHCQSNLIRKFKKKFGKKFSYEGNRAIIFNLESEIPEKELQECIAMALTYHLNK